MHTDAQDIETLSLAKSWDELLYANKDEMKLEGVELSALSSLMHDCLKDFKEISEFLRQIKSLTSEENTNLHDLVVDIYWKFDHIKNHIVDADKGFLELMRVLAAKD